MRVDVLVAEIGSTTTVVNAFTDLETDNPRICGSLAADMRLACRAAASTRPYVAFPSASGTEVPRASQTDPVVVGRTSAGSPASVGS